MIKLVAFDWNGCLLSDTRACVDADNAVLEFLGQKSVSLKRFRNTMNIPVIDFFVANGASRAEVQKKGSTISKLFHQTYERETKHVRTRAGTRKLLKWLKKQGIEAIILSNHTVVDINRQLKRLKLDEYFTEVLANPLDTIALKKRSKGEKLHDYMKQKKYKPSEVVIIGDSPEEIEIGKKLHVQSIAITDGYYSIRRLRQGKPDHLITKVDSIQRIVKNS